MSNIPVGKKTHRTNEDGLTHTFISGQNNVVLWSNVVGAFACAGNLKEKSYTKVKPQGGPEIKSGDDLGKLLGHDFLGMKVSTIEESASTAEFKIHVTYEPEKDVLTN